MGKRTKSAGDQIIISPLYIKNCLKGTSEWKQSWPPDWSVVPNRSAQNWPLQRALRNERFWRVQLIDTSGPHDPLCWFFPWWRHRHMGTGWWRRRALQQTVVWSPTPFKPSKLSLRRVNPLKGLGHRDEPFLMECRVIRGRRFVLFSLSHASAFVTNYRCVHYA